MNGWTVFMIQAFMNESVMALSAQILFVHYPKPLDLRNF